MEFGASVNPEAMYRMSDTLQLYDGGALDMAVLGFAEVDRYGNVNASSFHGRMVGPGGFIDITQNAQKLCFIGTFTAGKQDVGLRDNGLVIHTQGPPEEVFLAEVESITFSGREAVRKGQEVLYITERAVFRLEKEGITLVEIAHGVDLQRDILDQMEFQPVIPEYIRYMDPRLFRDGPMGLTPEQMEMVDPEYEFWRDLRRPKGEGGGKPWIGAFCPPADDPGHCPPHRYQVAYAPCPPQESDRCFLFRGREILEREVDGQLTPPSHLGELGAPLGESRWLFRIDETDYYLCARKGGKIPCPWGMPGTTSGSTGPRSPASSALPSPRPTTCPFGIRTTSSAAAAAGETQPDDRERMLLPPHCGNLIYPKIAPAVIVAVTDGDRILMTRYQGRVYKGYALIAGFTEIGETAEDTVRREVMEEVGLQIKKHPLLRQPSPGGGLQPSPGILCPAGRNRGDPHGPAGALPGRLVPPRGN